MKKLLVCAVLVLILLSSFTGVSLADGGPVYQAGLNVIPYNNNSIEMEKEDLFITFSNGRSIYPDKVTDRAKIRAKFIFKNTGNETDQKIGFPFGIPRIEGEFRIIEPIVKVNGKAVKAELANPENDSRWLIFTVHFAKNERKLVDRAQKKNRLLRTTFSTFQMQNLRGITLMRDFLPYRKGFNIQKKFQRKKYGKQRILFMRVICRKNRCILFKSVLFLMLKF